MTSICPTAALLARFPGLYIPILDLSFNGPAPTDTQFHTVEIIRQYDGFADFPLYPLNLIATVNAVLGVVYVHPYDLRSQPGSRSEDVAGLSRAPHGDTDYYFFQTDDLPLFAPLRIAGGARAGDRRGRAGLQGDRGTGL